MSGRVKERIRGGRGRGWVRWLHDGRGGVGCGDDKARGGGVVIDSSEVVQSACRGGRCVLERAPTPHV